MKALFNMLATFVIAMAVMTSCSDDGEPTSAVTVYDIVCLADMGDNGSVFTLTKPMGNELITYTATQKIDTLKVAIGQRMMLAYRIADDRLPYTTGSITAIGYSPVTNDTLRHGYISKIEGWDNDPVYLMSSWLSQDFLNMRVRIPYDEKPRTLAVLVDSLTLDAEYPDCYLVHRLAEPVNSFERSYYLSFDMSTLRDLKQCRGFNLILNNSNLKKDTYQFKLNINENN
ncbi:MAG: hypothetical protein NC082_03350 [Clostridiales bacterium]|nr:hypothetical protein [Clostridiales bacterium]